MRNVACILRWKHSRLYQKEMSLIITRLAADSSTMCIWVHQRMLHLKYWNRLGLNVRHTGVSRRCLPSSLVKLWLHTNL